MFKRNKIVELTEELERLREEVTLPRMCPEHIADMKVIELNKKILLDSAHCEQCVKDKELYRKLLDQATHDCW